MMERLPSFQPLHCRSVSRAYNELRNDVQRQDLRLRDAIENVKYDMRNAIATLCDDVPDDYLEAVIECLTQTSGLTHILLGRGHPDVDDEGENEADMFKGRLPAALYNIADGTQHFWHLLCLKSAELRVQRSRGTLVDVLVPFLKPIVRHLLAEVPPVSKDGGADEVDTFLDSDEAAQPLSEWTPSSSPKRTAIQTYQYDEWNDVPTPSSALKRRSRSVSLTETEVACKRMRILRPNNNSTVKHTLRSTSLVRLMESDEDIRVFSLSTTPRMEPPCAARASSHDSDAENRPGDSSPSSSRSRNISTSKKVVASLQQDLPLTNIAHDIRPHPSPPTDESSIPPQHHRRKDALHKSIWGQPLFLVDSSSPSSP